MGTVYFKVCWLRGCFSLQSVAVSLVGGFVCGACEEENANPRQNAPGNQSQSDGRALTLSQISPREDNILYIHNKLVLTIMSMNISLTSAAEKQKKAKLLYGLNTTNTTATTKSNVFGDDDDDDEEEEESGRDQVNRDLLREQESLRQRASSAMYDFDGTYDEVAAVAVPKGEKSEIKKESRYIADMMKKSVKRNYERDIAHERKLAKEQAAEEGDFAGKEKFITSAYKKQLAERELWKQEEEEQRQRDEREDVTKRKDGLSGFYSNFNKNVAMGGTEEEKQDERERDEETRPSFLDGFAAAADDSNDGEGAATGKPSFLDGFEASATTADETKEQEEGKKPSKPLLQLREEKIAQARLRYFERRGISEQEALQERY